MSGVVRSSPGSSQPPPPPPHHPPSSPVPVTSTPVIPPIRRHLAFASTKPPFHPSDDYHRFNPSSLSNNNDRSFVHGCGVVDREEDAVVVRSPVSFGCFWFFDLEIFPSEIGLEIRGCFGDFDCYLLLLSLIQKLRSVRLSSIRVNFCRLFSFAMVHFAHNTAFQLHPIDANQTSISPIAMPNWLWLLREVLNVHIVLSISLLISKYWCMKLDIVC